MARTASVASSDAGAVEEGVWEILGRVEGGESGMRVVSERDERMEEEVGALSKRGGDRLVEAL